VAQVPQVAKCLPGKCEALNSNPSIAKNKMKQNKTKKAMFSQRKIK
jgi:hypothetical protein